MVAGGRTLLKCGGNWRGDGKVPGGGERYMRSERMTSGGGDEDQPRWPSTGITETRCDRCDETVASHGVKRCCARTTRGYQLTESTTESETSVPRHVFIRWRIWVYVSMQ